MTGIVVERKINLVRVAHVYYTHKDIETARRFLDDFGLKECKRFGNKTYYRGYSREPFLYCAIEGDEPSFGGAAFVVETPEDLELASRTIPGASEIYDLTDAPGGGRCVTFHDPVDNFPFHLVHGQTQLDEEIVLPELNFNFPGNKNRGGGQYQRFDKRPAPVHKLGHFGMCVTNFDKAFEFYTSRFNFYPSDLGHNPEGKNVIAFNRLMRGKELVDHHTFFFFEGPKAHVHHSSFETHDFDTQVLGHDWLRHRGWENCWGIGRHVMGSQIFDYWFDASKFILEHYVDGDLCNDSQETVVSEASHKNLYVWGPDLPPTFLE
ncbi:uncharacterized protein TRIVIDRAFT_54998 [Trichoderma virens Gv29-8]|uniref:VOC domain-containing protein n=1 Tax=Hypocrea virens (strain Gv29-8 / FGSC 10586) TaxID=413071 RepID=G9MJD1_HYPVG|nr:uncharacterized protein TRIVIDRAFT_54998 [Trichoderma virens Gv29-8]EHK25594.1 hypothetical protein TRIVIDRAFT_54998 [Trichoderma virens Gv29-8]UKZ48586.1 hypothetical protein TrVGV298_002811 [Trichoderma virens]